MPLAHALHDIGLKLNSGGEAIRWQARKMAVPLSQPAVINADESTQEAIGDWHDWLAQGYCL